MATNVVASRSPERQPTGTPTASAEIQERKELDRIKLERKGLTWKGFDYEGLILQKILLLKLWIGNNSMGEYWIDIE